MHRLFPTGLTRAALLGATILAACAPAHAIDTVIDGNDGTLPLPNGQFVTPTFAAGATLQYLNPGLPLHPAYIAGFASASRVSPDGATLLVSTNGYNRLTNAAGTATDAPNQYVFVYDISGANKTVPALKQVLQVPDIYEGLTWAGNARFFVSGGYGDNVQVYDLVAGQFANTKTIALTHATTLTKAGAYPGIGGGVHANTSGIALTADGTKLVVANFFNDSVSIIDTATLTVGPEYDIRPYNTSAQAGVAGGEQPYDVIVHGNTAYVSSARDREVVVLDVSGATPAFVTRIKVPGSAKNLALSPAGDTLYVTQDVQDVLSVISTATNTIIENIDTRAPAGTIPTDAATRFTGAAPAGVTISADGKTAYVANAGNNSVAVIPLSGSAPHAVAALIPTAYFPQSVALSADGTQMYVVNSKSDTGANPAYRAGSIGSLTQTTFPGGNAAAGRASNASNGYQLQLERSALVSLPVPAPSAYAALTAQVAKNDFYSAPVTAADTATMAFLHGKIQHVIYIIKENRTYDQVLGDLSNGANGDPTLTVFGRRITPNFHRIATNFVTLDNFFDPADASMNGWSWSTQADSTDLNEKAQQLNYASRGLSYDSEGDMRNIDIGLSLAQRQAEQPTYAAVSAALPGGTPNLLPGPANVARQDAGAVFQGSVLWQSALRAGLSVRNYGFWVGAAPTRPANYKTIRFPFANGTPFVYAVDGQMTSFTDPYFLGFDQTYPDVWRVQEWQRDLAVNGLPNLTLLRLSSDHMGSFGQSGGGFNTPEQQQADNDLAVGRVVQTIAQDPAYAGNTLIFVTEDDTQDGPDHIDSHREPAYVVGPYVKQHAVVSTRYTEPNMIRTMEDILGTGYMNLNDALQHPMTDVFDVNQSSWTFNAVASTVLAGTMASIEDGRASVQFADGPRVVPTHDGAYWARATKGFDFGAEDRVPADLYNEVLWHGLMSGPYPAPHGLAQHAENVTK